MGRAQGGYDEMVFRAMVRDNAHFYDPLGVAVRAIRVNFQSGANAYLYGTRFFTYLAYVHSPEKVVAWIKRDEGSQRNYADQFLQVFGIRLDRLRTRIPAAQPGGSPEVSDYATAKTWPRTEIAISRMYYDEPTGTISYQLCYPGVVDYVGALNTRDGSIRRLATSRKLSSTG